MYVEYKEGITHQLIVNYSSLVVDLVLLNNWFTIVKIFACLSYQWD